MRFIFILIFIISVSYSQENFSPTYIPPNVNSPYQIEPNPYEKEINQLKENIEKDIQNQQNKNEGENESRNFWFYDIFKSLDELFD